jgi:type I restriction enzyme S subunit
MTKTEHVTQLDAGVAALERVQANLQRYRAAVLKAACEGRLVSTEAELHDAGKTSDFESGATLLRRIQALRRRSWDRHSTFKAPGQTQLPDLPKGWTWATLSQLGEFNRGKSTHRPRDDARLYGGPHPLIQPNDIIECGGQIYEHHQTYSEFGLTQSRLWPTGTLCITISSNVAETGVLTYPACFAENVIGFVPVGFPIIARYIELFIRSAKDELVRFAPATSRKNINFGLLQKIAIPIPPLAEQTRIVAEVDRQFKAMEELEATVAANLQRAESLSDSMARKRIQRNGGVQAWKHPRYEQHSATGSKTLALLQHPAG